MFMSESKSCLLNLITASLLLMSYAHASTEIYQTSRSGDRLANVNALKGFVKTDVTISLNPEERYQSIVGFGGAFTEAGAHALVSYRDKLPSAERLLRTRRRSFVFDPYAHR